MKSRLIAGVVMLAALGACQRTSAPIFAPPPPPPPPVVAAPAPSGPLVWGRLDCKRASTNPEIVEALSTDKAFCERQADIREGDGVTAALESCMGERGYRYRAKEEHDAYCQRSQRVTRR